MRGSGSRKTVSWFTLHRATSNSPVQLALNAQSRFFAITRIANSYAAAQVLGLRAAEAPGLQTSGPFLTKVFRSSYLVSQAKTVVLMLMNVSSVKELCNGCIFVLTSSY